MLLLALLLPSDDLPAHEAGRAACGTIFGKMCPSREAKVEAFERAPACAAVGPTPVGNVCKERVAGCAGLTGELCPRVCDYCASLVSGALCRLGRLATGGECPRAGMNDAWEPVGDKIITLTGAVGSGGGRGCAGLRPCDGCAVPRYSPRDGCLTHQDRDFVLDQAVGPEALRYLTPANMVSDRAHSGRDLEVETEWMYLFPQHPGRRLFTESDIDFTHPQPLGQLDFVPAPGDPLAAQGALVADCGHLDAAGFPRTELHPALALAWAHAEGAGRFSIFVRAVSHLDTDARRFRLQPLAVSVPLPEGAAEVASFRWEHLWRGYSVHVDHGCVLAGNGDHEQEHPVASLSDVDQSPVAAANARREAAAGWHELGGFALRVRASAGAALVELRPLHDEDPPPLVGARAEIVVR
jgi:hypothetical protein